MVFKSTWLAPYTGSAHVIFGRTIALKEMIYTCLYPSFLRDHKMYTHLFASRSFPLTWDENLHSFCNVTPSRVKLSLWSMPHSGGKSGVTPFLAIQSSLHLLVLQLISLTSVRSKNAFSAFCDSSTLFLRTVTRIEVSSAYLVRSLSWQYRATSRSFKNSLNKYPWVRGWHPSNYKQCYDRPFFVFSPTRSWRTSWQCMGLKGSVLVSILISCAWLCQRLLKNPS